MIILLGRMIWIIFWFRFICLALVPFHALCCYLFYFQRGQMFHRMINTYFFCPSRARRGPEGQEGLAKPSKALLFGSVRFPPRHCHIRRRRGARASLLLMLCFSSLFLEDASADRTCNAVWQIHGFWDMMYMSKFRLLVKFCTFRFQK